MPRIGARFLWTVQVVGAVGALALGVGACGKNKGRPGSGAKPAAKLSVVWEAKGHDSRALLVTEGKRPSVYRLDATGTLIRRDARTGKVIWRRPAPAGVRWTSFRVGRSYIALNGSPREGSAQAKSPVIAGLAVRDGRLLWKRDHPGRGSLGIALAGGGMFLEGGEVSPPGSEPVPVVKSSLGPCDVIAIHPESGAEISARFHGTMFFRRGRGVAGRPSCRHSAKVLDRRAGATIVAHYQARPRGRTGMTGLRLTAWADAKRSVWLKQLGVGPLWRVSIEPRLGVVSVSILRTLLVLRIDPSTGREVWRQSLKGTKSCTYSAIRVRVVPGPAKRLAILAQRCEKAILIEAKTGKVLWERATNDIAAAGGSPSLRSSWLTTAAICAACVYPDRPARYSASR